MAMTHATKMALVPHDTIQQIQQHPTDISPAAKATFALDNEMKDILNRNDLPEEEKLKLYNQILSRYLKLDKQRKEPLGNEIDKLRI